MLNIFILKCCWLPRVINIQLYRTGKVFCQLIYFLTSHTSAAVSWMGVPVSWVWYTKHRQKMWMRQACWKLNSLAVSITAFASCSPHARWMVRLLASHTRNANRWLLSDGTIKLTLEKLLHELQFVDKLWLAWARTIPYSVADSHSWGPITFSIHHSANRQPPSYWTVEKYYSDNIETFKV